MRRLASVLLACAIVSSSHAAPEWGYKGTIGPMHWGNLDPAFNLCATGKQQSPVSINTKKTHISQHSFILHTQPASYSVMTDGRSVQLNLPAKQQVNETLKLDGQSYQLQEFHFHTPSENEKLNETSPAEIQFVYQGGDGKLAVIAVFVKVGAANALLQAIINNLPKEEGKEVVMKEPLDISGLLDTKGGAYQYAGSLTTPPCTEGVTWLVMVDAMTASPEQIVKLRKAAHGANARPVQPLNKRQIVMVTAEKA